MSEQLIATIALAVLGILCGPLLALIAARRVVAQPVAVDSGAERRVLAAVAGDTSLVAVAVENTGLKAEHFAHAGRQAAWAAIAEAVESGQDEPVSVARDTLEAAGDTEGAAQLAQAVKLAEGFDSYGDGDLRDDDAGSIVMNFEDRTTYPGTAPVDAAVGEDPLVRRYQHPTSRRMNSSSFWVGGGFAISSMLTDLGGAAGVLTTAALCCVVALGYFVAVIDHDTLYLDFAGFGIGSIIAWGAAVAGLVIGDMTSNIWVGIAGAVIWAVVFELTNLVYKLLRGVNGQGFGDTLIVLTCVGVPTAVSGELLVGITAVVAAGTIAALAHLPQMLRRTHGMRTALPFGPFLAIGWVVAWPVLAWTGLI